MFNSKPTTIIAKIWIQEENSWNEDGNPRNIENGYSREIELVRMKEYNRKKLLNWTLPENEMVFFSNNIMLKSTNSILINLY